MQVTIDVFSGRANPSWGLSPFEIEEFSRRFRAAPRIGGARQVEGALGYRGLIVSGEPGREVDGCVTIVVFAGVASCERDGEVERRLDRGRELERWLLHTGAAHLDPDLYDQIARLVQPCPPR
ncbi:hypothetical protein BE17_15915 [Sorangium cellulosum]|uniref:Uncharacterized protein n=1 Tax=Sorangium cellulosum TaxID=56 RepID=A0A150RL77_SORCE|nr:hypothetical protein BE17_15915 [Sorangium cellulosum]